MEYINVLGYQGKIFEGHRAGNKFYYVSFSPCHYTTSRAILKRIFNTHYVPLYYWESLVRKAGVFSGMHLMPFWKPFPEFYKKSDLLKFVAYLNNKYYNNFIRLSFINYEIT